MICGKCNYDNPEGSAFCQHCGEPLTAQTPAEGQGTVGAGVAGLASKLPFNLNKKTLIGAAAAVCAVVLLIIIIAAAASGGSNYVTAADGVLSYVYNEEDDVTHFTYGTKVLKDKVDGSADGVTCADGSAAIIVVEEDDEYTLYYLTKSGIKKIADGVTDADISFEGRYGWYIDDEGTLYYCDFKNGKSDKVAEECGGNVVMSPDGKTLLYVVYPDADEDEDEDEEGSEPELWYKKGNKSERIAKNYTPVSVSNNGKYVYMRNDEGSLYATKLGSDDKNKIGSVTGGITVNSEGTEVVFISEDKAYISVKGGEKAKIGNASSMYFVLPQNGGTTVGPYTSVKTFVGAAVIYRKDSGSDASLGFFKKAGSEYELTRVANDVSSVETVDGKTFYYIKSGDLCKVQLKKNAESEELAEDIQGLSVTASGKIVYALDTDDTLWKIKGKSKDKVADDVEYGEVYAIGEGVVFISEYSDKNGEGTLYYSSNGKNKTKITDEAKYVYANAMIKFVLYENADGERFISNNGKKYTEVK